MGSCISRDSAPIAHDQPDRAAITAAQDRERDRTRALELANELKLQAQLEAAKAHRRSIEYWEFQLKCAHPLITGEGAQHAAELLIRLGVKPVGTVTESLGAFPYDAAAYLKEQLADERCTEFVRRWQAAGRAAVPMREED